ALNENTAVATITLNRPERLNALTFEVYEELRDAFYALDTEPGVRAVVITGAGRAFCSGGDVEDVCSSDLGRDYQGLLEFTKLTGDLVRAMRKCRRPIVAALNGTVAGAGAVIATASDIRIAAESAKIAFLFTRVGLSGADMGVSWLLPRIVGHGLASELLMTGDFIDAAEAHRIGLYNRVVPNRKVLDEARAFAEKLARGPSFGLAISKESLDREWSMDLDTALAWEVTVQAGCMTDPNFRESYEAFKAKREPQFARAPWSRRACRTPPRCARSSSSGTPTGRAASPRSARSASRRCRRPRTTPRPDATRARCSGSSPRAAGSSRSDGWTCAPARSPARRSPTPRLSRTACSRSRRSAPRPCCSRATTRSARAGRSRSCEARQWPRSR